MKTQTRQTSDRGFALIVTLSLMILLTVVAVGLLTLSSVSLRSSSQGEAMAKARANARLAALLAIGELQTKTGPDTRITAPADLVDDNHLPGLTGVWKSWRPPTSNPDYDSMKTGPHFLGYLMSNANPADEPSPSKIPAGKDAQLLVGENTVSSSTDHVSAPLVPIAGRNPATPAGGVSWVTLDEGVKGRIDLEPALPAKGTGEQITRVGSPARNGFGGFPELDFLASDSVNEDNDLREIMPKLVSLNQAGLAAPDRNALDAFFHDFSVESASVQADVANGGLKTDLSVLFESSNLPSDYSSRFLYSDSSQPLARSDPKWPMLSDYARHYLDSSAATGMRAALPSGYGLQPVADKDLKAVLYEPNLKNIRGSILMPTVVKIDTIFSLVARDARNRATATHPFDLHLMYLPVITLHNPYSSPLRFTGLKIEFADTPIGFEFLINGQPATLDGLIPLNDMYISQGGIKKNFSITLSNSLSGPTEVVMGPGETKVFGKPFPPNWKFSDEFVGSNGKLMFDWQNNFTQKGAPMMAGLISDPKSGVGFDVDWLAPRNRAPVLSGRGKDGVILLRKEKDDLISVRYGPKASKTAASEGYKFGVSVYLGNRIASTTQVFYKDEARLKEIVSEGTSPRFNEIRSFPEIYPKPGRDTPIRTADIYVPNSQPISDYIAPKAFAIFSLGTKTTRESYTPSRPLVDTGLTLQMATCDFTTSASQGNSPLEFALTPIRSGTAAIQIDGDNKGYFFGGHGTNNGTTTATIYEIPLAPLQSIAQLRHANTASIGSAPFVTYSIGESRAHPAIPSGVAIFEPTASRSLLDHSWLANDRLWDSYWFSTLATLDGPMYSGTSSIKANSLAKEFFTGARPLPNGRNRPYQPAGESAADAADEALVDHGRKSSARILTAGGFNVNSTSVAAWTAVLSGLSNAEVPLGSGGTEKVDDGAPFPRGRRPHLAMGGVSVGQENLWNSYRKLSADQIKSLAEQIVEEVRERGPFLSMSEFVNRRLGPPGDLTRTGAIQAALDAIGADREMESGARLISPDLVAGFGWENPSAVTRNTGVGAPGDLTQGDVLSAIGSFVTVRSDTFRIRAYGDARNGSGTIVARAWCEVIVQRVPEYVDPADLPEADATAVANLNFGRRFKTVSFRWLNSGEI